MKNDPTDLLSQMLLIRVFDERLLQLQREGVIPGRTSPYIGQEAIAVGVAAELAVGDYVVSHHRPTGHALSAGLDPGRLMAELAAKVDGYCRGKAGKHQISSVKDGFLGANGVVGGGIPIAAGAALAQKIRATSGVTVTYFGDGASNTGAFHETLNLAAVWCLPILFVCENNGYAFSSRQEDHQLVRHVSDRASAYGMPGQVVDGNDLEAVRGAVRTAVERARSGKGPTLLDMNTYRWYGQHDGDDSLSYRSQEEIDSWMRRCPIESYRQKLEDRGELEAKDFNVISENISKIVDRAVATAIDSDYSDVEEARQNVYAPSDVR